MYNYIVEYYKNVQLHDKVYDKSINLRECLKII